MTGNKLIRRRSDSSSLTQIGGESMRFKWLDSAQIRIYDEDNIFVERWFTCDEEDLDKIEDKLGLRGYEIVVERYDLEKGTVTGKTGKFCWDLEEAQRERKLLEEVKLDVQS